MDSPPVVPPTNQASTGGKLLKGCGCFTGLLVMALGILIIGDFDATAWASSLSAVIIGALVFRLSGINGSWEK